MTGQQKGLAQGAKKTIYKPFILSFCASDILAYHGIPITNTNFWIEFQTICFWYKHCQRVDTNDTSDSDTSNTSCGVLRGGAGVHPNLWGPSTVQAFQMKYC